MKPIFQSLYPYFREQGVAGFVEYMDGQDHPFLTRLFWALDNRLLGLAQLARDFAEIESRAEHKPLPLVARDLNDYFGMDLHIDRLPKEFVTENQPAILMGINHEAIIEPVLLLSLLDRVDIRFLGMKIFQYLGPNIRDQIFPVLPHRIATDYHGDYKTTLSNNFNFIYQIYRMEDHESEEIKSINQESIGRASDHIRAGGILMLYPTGGKSIDNDWYPGIGRILNGLPAEILSSIAIFPVKTTGLTRNQVYRAMRRASFGRQLRQNAYMHVLDTIHVPSHMSGAGANKIVDYIKNQTTSQLRTNLGQSSLLEMKKLPFDA